MNLSPPFPLDRSRIKARRECPSFRYWHYHKKLMDQEVAGLQLRFPGYNFAIGLAVHKGLEVLLKTGDIDLALTACEGEVRLYFTDLPDRLVEMLWLCQSMVYGWYSQRYHAILADYDILATEQTYTWRINGLFDYNFRVDALLERKDDKRIVILDFKTTKKASYDWAKSFEHDLQPMLYIRALEEIMGLRNLVGMQFEGIVKGDHRVDTNKTSPYYGKVIQYSPYCYGYKNSKTNQFQLDYIKGVPRIAAWETGMSVKEWFDEVILPSSALYDLFATVPPIRPLPTVIDATLSSIIETELDFMSRVAKVEQVRQEYPTLVNATEDKMFERFTERCWKYGAEHPCEFYDLCWTGGVRDNPTEHGYIPREPNHEE